MSFSPAPDSNLYPRTHPHVHEHAHAHTHEHPHISNLTYPALIPSSPSPSPSSSPLPSPSSSASPSPSPSALPSPSSSSSSPPPTTQETRSASVVPEKKEKKAEVVGDVEPGGEGGRTGEDEGGGPRALSRFRKISLLLIFCCAQFVDVYNASAVVLATAPIANDLGMTTGEGVWTLSAYVLVFAGFMLPMGKLADIWSAKAVFTIGLIWVGAFSIGIALAQNKITLFLLRAFAGLGAAASIPAALNLIVHIFPAEGEQHVALACFGGAGELANVSGFILGGVLLLAGWRWVFWLLPIVCFPMALVTFFLIPSRADLKAYQLIGLKREEAEGSERATRILKALDESEMSARFDYGGTFLIVAAAVLAIFGLTDGGESGGWARAQPIVCLVLGLLLFPLFFWYESRIDQRMALIPSSIWRIQNVTVLVVISLVPYFWWYGVQYNFANIMQEDWDVSPIMTAVRFLPISIGGGIMFVAIGYLPPTLVPLKLRMIVGAIIATIGTILFVFADGETWYWKVVAPGMFVGSFGMAIVFLCANNSILMSVPPEYSGVVGGIFNACLQLGAVAGLAMLGTIKLSFQDHSNGGSSSGHTIEWAGYRASFIFMAGCCVAIAVVAAIWFKNPLAGVVEQEKEAVHEEGLAAQSV